MLAPPTLLYSKILTCGGVLKLKEEKEKRREERRERRNRRKERRDNKERRRKEESERRERRGRDGENSNKRKRENSFTSQESSSRCLPDAIVHGLELLQCKDLLEKLLLPPEVEDSDWLNTNTNRRSEEMKRQRCGSDTLSCSRASTPWPPRAQYLHHIDAYALPYILPF